MTRYESPAPRLSLGPMAGSGARRFGVRGLGIVRGRVRVGEVGELGALGRLGLCLYATWVQEASSVGSVSMGWLGVVPDVDINEELDLEV